MLRGAAGIGSPSTTTSSVLTKEESTVQQQSTIMLIKAIIGGAALVFPQCYLRAGIGLSTLALLLAGWAGVVVGDLLMETRRALGPNVFSFREMGVATFKSNYAGYVLDFTVTLQSFGTLVGFVVAVGDLVSFQLRTNLGVRAQVEVPVLQQVVSVRTYALILLTLFAYFPLCLLRRLDSLRALAAFTMFVYVFFLVVLAQSAFDRREAYFIDVDWYHADGVALFRVLPIIALSYSCVPLMMEVRSDLEHKLSASPRLELAWQRVTLYAFAASGTFYILTGLLGYLSFATTTRPNVLTNLQEEVGGWLAAGVNSLFAASLIVSYPLICFVVRQPFRRALLAVCLKKPSLSSTTTTTTGGGEHVPFWIFSIEAMCVTVLTLSAAIAMPGLDVALEFIGGTAAVFVNYLAPVIMFLVVRPERTFRRDVVKALLIGSVGTLVSCLTLGGLFRK